ncbi:MAG: type II secretion system F family protein [Actinobacteria bacterium]|nr:type II secretion system F family protein [Actinomycetota bacterium]
MSSTELFLGLTGALVVIACAAPVATGARPSRILARVDDDDAPARRPLRGRRRERLLDTVYPDALDLFVVTVQAGRLPHDALSSIEPQVHPIIGAAIRDVDHRVRAGERFADALDALVDALGTRALSLVATIALAERTGLAVTPMIDRIADDARLHRRRRAEAAARELPVRLALPLVLCTLPSFVLVAIAPLLIGALSSLRGT